MAATLPVRRVEAPKPARHTGSRALRQQLADPPAPSPRPDLRIVPKPRVAYNAALVLGFVVVVLMLGTVVLHTRLAERQGDIDRLEAAVTDAREQFDVLRQQRAELRSPTRLAIEARDHGMVPTPGTNFLAVDPVTLAQVLASAGIVDDATGTISTEDPLDQIRRVKAADGSAG
jgi:hypothetical protein